MNRLCFSLFLYTFILLQSKAQQSNLVSLDSLRIWSDILYSAKLEETRRIASDHVESLMINLIEKNILNQESLHPNIVVLKIPDQNIYIYTWQVELATQEFEYKGLIRLDNGIIIQLSREQRDISRIRREDFNPSNWYGAVYYHILPQSFGDKKYYLLFGFTQNQLGEKYKIIEPISISNGSANFGLAIFPYIEEDKEKSTYNRVVIKYSQTGNCMLKYEELEQEIVYDHMIPFEDMNSPEITQYLPDGSYEAYKYENNKWNYISKLKIEVQKTAPRDKPILDNSSKDIFGKVKK